MGFVAPFFCFFAIITSIQMRRIEGGMGLLSLVQLTSAVVVPTDWCYPLCYLAVAAFRSDRDPQTILALSDLYHLTMLGVAALFPIRIPSLKIASGPRSRRPYPRIDRISARGNYR